MAREHNLRADPSCIQEPARRKRISSHASPGLKQPFSDHCAGITGQIPAVYDFGSGISYQVHIFSLGAHADYEPLTANDTAKMLKIFGKNTWNPKPIWVIFADGSVYMASTHSTPHGTQHMTDNNFAGHSCIHFPRTQEQVEAIGPYATKHQSTIDAGWATTQKMR